VIEFGYLRREDRSAAPDRCRSWGANLTVTLRSDEYDLCCPVGNHEQMGMDMNVSVAAGGGTATNTDGAGGGDDGE
jgi:hypothetical protein